MAIAHRPLFGLTCVDEAMPSAMEVECAMALEDASALRAAVERAQVPALASSPGPIARPPAAEPDFAPTGPSFGPGRR